MKKILITGTAGFIGFHLVNNLLKETNWQIVGLDNINDYYDVNLKYARLLETGIEKNKIKYNSFTKSVIHPRYSFIKLNLEDREKILSLFENEKFDYVVNLAAQAGVRYSIENPYAYIDSNVVGFINILEGCRHNKVKHLFYASSSSVYGNNKKLPFSVDDNVDHPISLYAATKKSNELMAHTYTHIFDLPTTGLRFFTVYGPWGRPDMALFIFTKKILEGLPIDVFNYGKMKRDFTYIDDIVNSITKLIYNDERLFKNTNSYNVFNIGNSNPDSLIHFIELIEENLNKKAKINLLPIQPGDVPETFADVESLENLINYKPSTSIRVGINLFINWYKNYFKITQ